MTPSQLAIIAMFGLLVAIISAIAGIVVIRNVYLKYGLLFVIIGIVIIFIIRWNGSNIDNTGILRATKDNTYKTKNINSYKVRTGSTKKKEIEIVEPVVAAIDCQTKSHKEENNNSKEVAYRYKELYFQNGYLIDLKGCRRERDIIYCEIDIGNNEKDHSLKFFNNKDFSGSWAAFIIDSKGNKYSPTKLNFTSGVEKVGWGRDSKYNLKPNFVIGLQFEYKDVPINISKLKQIYIVSDIFSSNKTYEGSLIIDIKNILIY